MVGRGEHGRQVPDEVMTAVQRDIADRRAQHALRTQGMLLWELMGRCPFRFQIANFFIDMLIENVKEH